MFLSSFKIAWNLSSQGQIFYNTSCISSADGQDSAIKIIGFFFLKNTRDFLCFI